MKIFPRFKILRKGRFTLFTVLYAAAFLVYCLICANTAFAGVKLKDTLLVFLPNLSPSLFNAPLAAMVWTAVSFFLILFTAWQTDLKAQKLTRFVLLAESFNLVLTVIGMTIGEGIRFTIIMLGLLFLLLAVPTLIVIKVKEMNGTYDYSDVLTPAEYEAYKNRKRRTPPKEK